MFKKFICPLTIKVLSNEWLIDVASNNRTLLHFHDVTAIAQSRS